MLLLPKVGQFLLLEHFKKRLLQGFADQNFEYRFYFDVEVEKLQLANARFVENNTKCTNDKLLSHCWGQWLDYMGKYVRTGIYAFVHIVTENLPVPFTVQRLMKVTQHGRQTCSQPHDTRGGRSHNLPTALLFQNFSIRVLQFFKFENPTPVQTPATTIDPTEIYPCFYLINDHTDSCYRRSWKATLDPSPFFYEFLTPHLGPKEKRRNPRPPLHYTARSLYTRRKVLTSPSSICVATSFPVLAGTNKGDGGRSRKASVCVSTSASSILRTALINPDICEIEKWSARSQYCQEAPSPVLLSSTSRRFGRNRS